MTRNLSHKFQCAVLSKHVSVNGRNVKVKSERRSFCFSYQELLGDDGGKFCVAVTVKQPVRLCLGLNSSFFKGVHDSTHQTMLIRERLNPA